MKKTYGENRSEEKDWRSNKFQMMEDEERLINTWGQIKRRHEATLWNSTITVRNWWETLKRRDPSCL